MHVRFSTCRGLLVVEEGTRQPLGTIAGILIHPQTGLVEGFFIRVPGFLTLATLFLSSNDIRHWGLKVQIADAHALSPIEDFVRCQSILESGKVIIGQPMVTEDGVALGRCRDVQFSTGHFQVEWLFPRRMFRALSPIAFSDVREVRRDAIVVRSGAMLVPATPAVVMERAVA